MSNFESDLNEFFNEFSETGTWTPSGVGAVPVPVKCIPRGPSVTPSPMTGGVVLQDTSTLCITSEISAAKEGETLAIGGVTYYILSNEPDGTGTSRVQLSKDPPHGRK